MKKSRLGITDVVWNYRKLCNVAYDTYSFEKWKNVLQIKVNSVEPSPYHAYPGRNKVTVESDVLFRIAVKMDASLLFKYPNTIINAKNEIIDWDFFVQIKHNTTETLERISGITRENLIMLIKFEIITPFYNGIFFKRKEDYISAITSSGLPYRVRNEVYSYDKNMTHDELVVCLDYFKKYRGITTIIKNVVLPKSIDYQYIAKYMITEKYVKSFLYYGDNIFFYKTIQYSPVLFEERAKIRGDNQYSHTYMMEYLDYYCPNFKKSNFLDFGSEDINFNYDWRFTF